MKLQSTSDQAAVVTPENIDRNTPLLETIISNIAKGLAASKKQDSESLLALISSLKIAQDSLRKDWTSHPWSWGASCEIERIAKDRSQNILKNSTLPLFANHRDLKKKNRNSAKLPRHQKNMCTDAKGKFDSLSTQLHRICVTRCMFPGTGKKEWRKSLILIFLKILTVSHSGVRGVSYFGEDPADELKKHLLDPLFGGQGVAGATFRPYRSAKRCKLEETLLDITLQQNLDVIIAINTILLLSIKMIKIKIRVKAKGRRDVKFPAGCRRILPGHAMMIAMMMMTMMTKMTTMLVMMMMMMTIPLRACHYDHHEAPLLLNSAILHERK